MRKGTVASLLTFLLLVFTASPALGQGLEINEFLADPNPGVDLNNDGSSDSDDEFVEILNTGSTTIDLSGYQLDDETGGSSPYTFPDGASIDPGEAAVVIGDAMGVDLPGFTGSGLPGLNNTGDDIRLINDQGVVVASYTYSGDQGSDGVSAARNRSEAGDPFQPQTDFGVAEAESAGFDNNDGSALPVEFAGAPVATVNGQDVTLRWTTLTEENNLGFYVQHQRTDQSAWTTAPERVDGAGNSASERHYDYTVADLAPGTYTFRVKQEDTDGDESFSQGVEATVRAGGFALQAPSQNPFQGRTVLRYSAPPELTVNAALYNSLGQQVRTLSTSANRIEVRAEGLASGLYFVRLTAGDRVDTQSITLVR